MKAFPPGTMTIYDYIYGRWTARTYGTADGISEAFIATCVAGPLREVNRTSTYNVWIIDGILHTFNEWCKITNKSDSEIIELKLMYDTTYPACVSMKGGPVTGRTLKFKVVKSRP